LKLQTQYDTMEKNYSDLVQLLVSRHVIKGQGIKPATKES
jgi:hypothetical protein